MSSLMSAAVWLQRSQAFLHGSPEALEGVREVVTDSREAGPGTLFLTLPGARTRGWDYCEQAREAGCRAFWGPEEAATRLLPLAQSGEVGVLISTDPLGDLGRVARAHLEERSAFRIGVTGSQGKTTLKEMLRLVFSVAGETFATGGNRNSVISLPGEALKVDDHHRWAIFEMGIDHVGEMDRLAELVRPQAAVITGIGTAHAENLGGRDGIARQKIRIASWMGSDDLLLIPSQDDYAEFLRSQTRARVEIFGLEELEPGSLQVDGQGVTHLRWRGVAVQLQAVGEHYALLALAALKLGWLLGVELTAAAEALGKFQPLPGRGRLLRGEIDIWDDTYNANPQSVAAFLRAVKAVRAGRRLALVLGSMLELGDLAEASHRHVAQLALALEPDLLIWVGGKARTGWEAAQGAGERNLWFNTAAEAVEHLRPWLRKGDLLAVKGSRAVALDQVVREFAPGGVDAV